MTTPDVLFAIVLLLASMLAALLFRRAASPTRRYGLAAALFFAMFALLHVTGRFDRVSASAASILLVTGSVALGLAVYRAFTGHGGIGVALFVFILSATVAFAAIYFDRSMLALLPVAAAVIAMLVIGLLNLRSKSREALLIVASAAALGAGAAAFAVSGSWNLLLFGAAALVGIALAVSPASRAVVNKPRWTRRTLSIRRKS